jgi:hypothetical protein
MDLEKSKGHWVWLWVWTKSQFYNCYQDNSPGCVTNLLNSLQWESLLQRQWKQTLVMCYKIHHQLIAIEPANYYTYTSYDSPVVYLCCDEGLAGDGIQPDLKVL